MSQTQKIPPLLQWVEVGRDTQTEILADWVRAVSGDVIRARATAKSTRFFTKVGCLCLPYGLLKVMNVCSGKATRVRLMMDDGSASLSWAERHLYRACPLIDDGKGQKPLIQSATRQLLIQLLPKISEKLRL